MNDFGGYYYYSSTTTTNIIIIVVLKYCKSYSEKAFQYLSLLPGTNVSSSRRPVDATREISSIVVCVNTRERESPRASKQIGKPLSCLLVSGLLTVSACFVYLLKFSSSAAKVKEDRLWPRDSAKGKVKRRMRVKEEAQILDVRRNNQHKTIFCYKMKKLGLFALATVETLNHNYRKNCKSNFLRFCLCSNVV